MAMAIGDGAGGIPGANRPWNVIAAEVHPSTLLQDERKKQPATMLRSSWAFKHSPFFAPDHETSTRPLRRLAVYPQRLDAENEPQPPLCGLPSQ